MFQMVCHTEPSEKTSLVIVCKERMGKSCKENDICMERGKMDCRVKSDYDVAKPAFLSRLISKVFW